MSRTTILVAMVAAFSSAGVQADAPRVATDIAPVHSLAARVMQGVGSPALIVPPGMSPHEHALRPSDADALQSAELVFWMGEGLAPWLDDALDTLATNAKVVSLPELEGVRLLDMREGALFEAHEHHDEEEHENEHEEEHEEEHDVEHDMEHAHDHGDVDPHAWLSPVNAVVWIDAMAAELSRVDSANAGTYAANAAAARAELEALKAEVDESLEPVRELRFVVFHDAYQYFEDAFGLSASGAISLSDASDPSPARIEQVQQRIRDENIGCVLAEPQYNDALVATVTEGVDARIAVIDPLGAALQPGPSLYPGLLRGMAESLNDCF